MDPIEQFVKNFHEIDGITIGERSRNVNILANNFSSNNKFNDDDLERMNVLLQPKNILEDVFKLDVFLTLKYAKYLFAIFEGENNKLIGRMIKSKWLFREAFSNVNSANLLDLFKRVSPITRGKIIIKLSSHLRNETIAEEYYVTIRNNYGLSAANKLLPVCSVPFVKKVLENDRVEIQDKPLLRIIKKDLQFARYYFERCKTIRYVYAENYFNSLYYVVLNDIGTFLEIIAKCNFKMKLNERRTTDICNAKKDDIIANPNSYLQIAHYRTLCNSLNKDEFYRFYKNTFAKSLIDYDNAAALNLINHLPREERYDLVKKTFRENYETDILDSSRYVTDEFLRIMPIEERVKWAKVTMKDRNEWMCYLPTKDSLPAIYEMINLTSDVKTRSTYAEYLIETCKLNDDEEALLKILRYYLQRHRNEDGAIRGSFLLKLSNTFKLERVSDDHWTEIFKLLKLFDIKKDHYIVRTHFPEIYLHRLYRTNQIDDVAILKYFKLAYRDIYMEVPFKNNNKYKKMYLLSLPDIILNNYEGVELFNVSYAFATNIQYWNRDNPSDKINLYNYPKIVDALLTRLQLEDEERHLSDSVLTFLIDLESDEPQNVLVMSEFWKRAGRHAYSYADILSKIVKRKPLELYENCDKFASTFYFSHDCYVTQLKYYAHLGLPQKFKEIYLAKLHEEYNDDTIRALVHFLPAQEYIDLMSEYHVKDTKINIDGDGDTESRTYRNRATFIETLKYVDTYSLTLPLLEQSCVGDYLRMSLDTLYRVVDYTPIPKTEELLKKLSDRAVSVRKHYVFLIANTRDEQTVYDTLKTLAPKEKNPSLLKFIFKRTYKHFRKNPSDRFLDLMRINSQYINKNDEEAYQYFTDCDDIPYSYLSRFIIIAWECMSESGLTNVREDRFRLLDQMDAEQIRMLPDTFSKNVIESYLCNRNDCSLINFACKYIGDNTDNLSFVCDVLKEYMKNEWSIRVESEPARSRMKSILNQFCSSFRERNLIDHLKFFANIWYEIIDVINGYEEHLILQFNILYLTAANDNCKMRNFAESIAKCLDQNIAKYGHMITNMFADVLNDCYGYLLPSTKDGGAIYDFLDSLLDVNETSMNCALALKLLPTSYSWNERLKVRHESILNKINRRDDVWLKILYANYRKKMN